MLPTRFTAALFVGLLVSCSVAALRSEGRAQCDTTRVLASDAQTQDNFGSAVALDGDVMVVGAWNEDTSGSDAGAAYVYRRSGANWVEEAKLVPSDGEANDLFGHAVAIDGDVIAVGGYAGVQIGIINGAVYVYRFDGVDWIEEQKLTTSLPALSDFFSYSVAVDGDRVAVGDPGNSIFTSPPGRVFVFDYNGVSWNETAMVTASDGHDNDAFGWAIDFDDDRLLVGAPQLDGLGTTRGGAYLFSEAGGTWTEQVLLTAGGADFDQLGWSVALDGDRAVATALQIESGAGPTGPGKAVVYEDDGSGWSEVAELTALSIGSGMDFGHSVAIAGDSVVVGAPSARTSGVGVHFGFDGLAWSEVGLIEPALASNADDLGFSVAIDVGRVALSAPLHDFASINAGACFVVELGTTDPSFVRAEVNGDGTTDVGDAIWILTYIFQDGDPPPCERAADANGDTTIDLGDAIFLINYFFLDGPEPPGPFPVCGVEPGSTPLCCAASSCP